ncbi:MAG: DinB family protein [Armatimonadetes bacterium]|nr:DinB family protein [Armatimonadota bacterium]
MTSLVEYCKRDALDAMEHFLRNFSHVPDDKLNWSPTPTSKSALRIAAHTAVAIGNFTKMMRDRRLPYGDEIPEFMAQTAAREVAITTREEAEELLRKNMAEVITAMDDLTDEEAEMVLDTGQGWQMPMSFLMKLPSKHTAWHIGQIDFLQTCWDDQEIYVG